MPGTERESSRDRDTLTRTSHSWSDAGRANIPMWDSSDPDRAPPPLPLNPGSQSPTTKANTSAGIAAAAKQIVERARESTPISSYTRNTEFASGGSPERSLIKGAHHRRMQSFQSGNVKDLRSFLDNRSPERTLDRPSSTGDLSTVSRRDSREDVHIPDRVASPPSVSRDPLKDTPTLRPSTRPPPRPLLGENTPPSATVLALQTMQVPEEPLSDMTNFPNTPSPSRLQSNFDFSNQLSNLTNIANRLQQEMEGLSRRSRDNATDLCKLQEASNKRDKEIHKTLQNLATSNAAGLLGPPPVIPSMRSTSSSATFLDDKPFSSPSPTSKPFNLPRAASAHSFLDDTRIGSPSPYSVEGAASVAMLEKIIREMVTKEGQERLQSSLSALLDKNQRENSDTAKKVEELSEFIKDKSGSQALVALPRDGPPKLDFNCDPPGMMNTTRNANGKEAKMIGIDDELMNMLKRIKESIAHSGGTTAEVKGIARDLRGEVLGMGRELHRKLDQISEAQLNNSLDRSIEDGHGKQSTEEVRQVVEEGLEELRSLMSKSMRQQAGESDRALSVRNGPDENQIFQVVKHALSEHSGMLTHQERDMDRPSLDHGTILEAVKEGLKDFEPNIELQQFGLERDEILSVLKEGLDDYKRPEPESAKSTVDKGEIYEVMQEALKDFQVPLPVEEIAMIKDDLLTNVRQALEQYQFQASGMPANDNTNRAAIAEAVHDAMASHGVSAPREIEISREDLFDAVKASLDGSTIPFGGFGEQVLQQLHELIDGMRLEFKQYSTANGRDTEQVLDAVRDGLESLRAGIESYVDRAQDVTGKDEIVDTFKGGLEELRLDVQGYLSQSIAPEGDKANMLDYIKREFELLHDAIGTREMHRETASAEPYPTAEMVLAIKEGIEGLKSHVETRRDFDDDVPKEEMLEALREEFEQLKSAVLSANAHDKSELIETLQDNLGALHAKLNASELSGLSGGAVEDIIQEVRAEFSVLKESLHAIIADGDRDAIVSGVRNAIDDLRTQLSADQSDASAEALGAIKEELERFRDMMGGSIAVPSAISGGVDIEALETIRSDVEEIKENAAKSAQSGITDEMLEALRGEFESLRNSIAKGSVEGGSHEEVLDTVHLGLDDLRSHIDKKLGNPEQAVSHHGEILDAINDGLESLKTDIVKTLDKPLDMTVNYEILDTLKDGLAGLHAEFDKLKTDDRSLESKSGEIVLADDNTTGEAREVQTGGDRNSEIPSGIDPESFGRMEVLLTQLQIKIEAMDASLQDLAESSPPRPAEGSAMKDDIVSLEAVIRELQESVTSLAHREEGSGTDATATKADTDAIETLLRNIKAHLEDMAISSESVSKENLDAVEAVVRVTNDAVEAVAERLENTVAAKADVAVVEVLAQDVKMMLEEMKDRTVDEDSASEKADRLTKEDLDVLGIICTEIKTTVNDLNLPDPEKLSSKEDMEHLRDLITEFRESHDKMREGYENDIAVTAKAFDDRKKEFEDNALEMSELRTSLQELKDELLAKMEHGDSGIDTLGETLKNLEEISSHEPMHVDIKELIEKVTQEFERAHDSLEAMKVDHQQTAESSLESQAENRSALETLINEKLETYFDGLMSKYDDAQRAAEESAKAMVEKAQAQEDMLNATKIMTDDLKLSIDTLGTTLTTIGATFPDTVERLAEESKTVFNKVDDAYNKLDETQEGLRVEHGITRDEISKVLAAVDGVQSDISEHNPRFMVALKEVQALIGQHYEHSQQASQDASSHTQSMRELREEIRRLGTQNDELRDNVTSGFSSLPALMPASSEGPPGHSEKSNDREVHEKLDRLMGHAQEAASASTQLQRLDQIHEKVMSTAAEVSAFVSQQSRQITEDHVNKEKEAEELALLLERRQVQKDEIEDDITVLNDEKESVRAAVEALKAEKEALSAEKARLAVEVSSLETAMHIRRDELHEMDRKAETLERRMLEGVMNQSRLLLLSKSAKTPTTKPSKGRDLRVPSNSSAKSSQTVTSSTLSSKPKHSLALRAQPQIQRNSQAPNIAERRIMSLNQINHNVPNGASAFSPTPSLISGGPQSLKRSHSVKTQSMRKPSWTTRNLAVQNKENDVLPEESDEETYSRPQSRGTYEDELDSEAGTERRGSHLTAADDAHYDGTDDGGRTSYGTSDLSYETGSYLTGSELDHRISMDGSSNGVLGVHSAIDEEPEDGDEVYEEADAGVEKPAPLQIEPPSKYDIVKDRNGNMYAPPSDSGLGTDAPTAALSSVNGSYFHKD